jgi:hypothetical protein
LEKKMKKIIILTILFLSNVLFTNAAQNDRDVMAGTGATPVAFREKAPTNNSLKITGLVKQEYFFSGEVLNTFATIRIRTHEISKEGTVIGTYAYTGIPVIHILEGIKVKKPDKAVDFDRPLDFIVTFTSSSGKSVNFGYGEIVFVNDALPITLAFSRKEIRASKNPDKYDKNINKENIKGLRLVSPRDANTSRYLDDVITITLRRPVLTYNKLPLVKKGECNSKSVICVTNNTESIAKFESVDLKKITNWFRTGHGAGFKGISEASGYILRSFLKMNFPDCSADNYFLFTACDGYRCIFSGREIFESSDGDSMMIVEKIDGKDALGGYMLAPAKDYFVDRDVWGLTHIIMLDKI